MKPAQERLEIELDRVEIADPRIPLANNVDAELVSSAARVREGLKRQVTAPVRWDQAMRVLRSENVERFIEVGPGKVLSGLLRQIDPRAECLRAEDRATLNEVLARLGAG
jgi:[acyl-carrier-protein] S-malonyltransferase